jgi:restriction system protein
VRTDRDTFASIKLRRVDPIACLKHLEAGLSPQPDALDGIQPVLDFDREADADFTEEFNVLADIDERPNVLALPDDEFEQLVQDLFGNMGLETGAPTRTPNGWRWLAADPRPIFGGKVVIYATRGASADAAAAHSLAGAVAAAGAMKGILVATAGFEPDAHEAVAGRPLELIDGPALLTLLAEHSRIKARLEPPDAGRTASHGP